MTTPLSLYLSAIASSTLSTANQLFITSGSPTSQENTIQLGTATGYSQLYAQGTTANWAGLSSIGSPDGHGFFLDSVLLEGQQLPAASYSGNIRSGLKSSGSTGSFTFYLRLFKYKAGVYTPIVTMSSNSINYSVASAATVFFNSATGVSMTFEVGARLYLDVWVNCTANNAGLSTQKLRFGSLSLDSSGQTGSSLSSITTPGYQSPSTTKTSDLLTRLLLRTVTTVSSDLRTRFLLRSTSLVDLRTRLLLRQVVLKDSLVRLSLLGQAVR